MKYVVEIDTTSKVGEEAIAYLRSLKKSSKAVHIREVEQQEDDNRPFTAADDIQSGGLAGAIGAKKARDLTLPCGKTQILQDAAASIRLAKRVDFNHRRSLVALGKRC